jgi:hypothetical protein
MSNQEQKLIKKMNKQLPKDLVKKIGKFVKVKKPYKIKITCLDSESNDFEESYKIYKEKNEYIFEIDKCQKIRCEDYETFENIVSHQATNLYFRTLPHEYHYDLHFCLYSEKTELMLEMCEFNCCDYEDHIEEVKEKLKRIKPYLDCHYY